MLLDFFHSRLALQRALPWLPVAADILTDPLGCKAKVRGNYRYGVYMPAQSPDGLYYEIRRQEDLSVRHDRPLTFTELVSPIGFALPMDETGERLKCSINTSVVFDMQEGKKVEYPLAMRAQG